MTAPATPAVDLTLDACAALQADLAAREAPNAAAPPAADAPPQDAPPAEAAQGAWLLLVLSVERAAQLGARARPAHFRAARAVWDDAATALAEPKYAAVGARLARWRAQDPTLPLVKELLWAFEQPEAAGYERLAIAGYSAVGRLLPADDVRRGYVLSQSARAARTLGDLQSAIDRYEAGERLGTSHRDRWLSVRSRIGLSAVHRQLGNYPAARQVFDRVLRQGSPDPRFTAAAHHGLVLAAMSAQDWETALHHGWHLLRAARAGVVPRVDALLLMAGLCRRIGRYRAAVSAALAGLRLSTRPEDPVIARKILADVGLASDDRELAVQSSEHLRALLFQGAGPYEDARALQTIALVEERWGSTERALEDAEHAHALARGRRYHELAYEIEPMLMRMRGATSLIPSAGVPLGRTDSHDEEQIIELSASARRIVSLVASTKQLEEHLAIAI